MKHFNYLLIPLLAALLSGCGGAEKGPALHPVSGTVTLDGNPLAEGSITLDPSGSTGTPTMGGIKDGAFEFEAATGEYTVRFAAMESTGEKDQYDEEITESIIPDEFNANSKLTASIKEGENNLSFEITRKAK